MESTGFSINEQFSDEKALCLILKEDSVYAMLTTREYLQTFTDKPVADGSTTQVLLAIGVGSRERVDQIMRIALENGATRYLHPEDEGWMYYDRFADPDGNQWEIAYLDQSLITKASEPYVLRPPCPIAQPHPSLRNSGLRPVALATALSMHNQNPLQSKPAYSGGGRRCGYAAAA